MLLSFTTAAALHADIIEGTEGRWDKKRAESEHCWLAMSNWGTQGSFFGIAGCQAWHGSIELNCSTG